MLGAERLVSPVDPSSRSLRRLQSAACFGTPGREQGNAPQTTGCDRAQTLSALGARLDVGQQVLVGGVPPKIGTVTQLRPIDGSLQVEVFLDGASKLWFPVNELTPISPAEIRVVDHERFLVELLLTKRRLPLADVLYTYRGSRTTFEVYQFKPVFKFLASDRRSLLIADEVGLGKTIEASLIYLELKARSDLPRTLILCPSSLREKWQNELRLRFDEDFQILDSHGLKQFLTAYEGTGGLQRLKGIASIELIRRQDLQQEFARLQVNLDLLIVDEAHHARNASTETHRAVHGLADHADNVILLTATPLQTHTSDLYNILQLVDPATFDDPYLFEEILRPNTLVNRAVKALGEHPPKIRDAAVDLEALRKFRGLWENPILKGALRELHTPGDWLPERVVRLRRVLLELNSLAFVFTRTRKRDVQNVAKRSSLTHHVHLRAEERAFYDAMLAYVRRRLLASSQQIVGFAMVMRERQAASCLPAARDYLMDLLRTRRSDLGYEGTGTELDEAADLDPAASEIKEIEGLVALAKAMGEGDSKFDSLLTLLAELTGDAQGSKLLVFSFFRRTISYLERRLRALGHTVFVIHGGVRPFDRQATITRFKEHDGPAILLSSEVGAEGLDFQFANTLVNYDLPWNPMRIEQRIGRIDRYGQRSAKIRIVNLVISDTIEDRILMRLLDRIRIFEESIGDLEPIVGPVIQELTRKVLTRALSAVEQAQLAKQEADRIVNLRAEQEDFEAKKAELMAQDSLFLADVEDAVNGGRVISAAEVAAGLSYWLRLDFPNAELRRTGTTTWLLQADAKLQAYFSSYLAGLREKSEAGISLLQLMSKPQGIPCTFDDRTAMDRKALQFLHSRHPLIVAAIDALRERAASDPSQDLLATRLEYPSGDIEEGQYTFFVNSLHVSAMSDQVRFAAIAFDAKGKSRPDVASRVLSLVLEATDREHDFDEAHYRARYSLQMGEMARLRDEIEDLVRRNNDALVETRIGSVNRTFDAKIAKRRAWLRDATNEGIRRMRRGEIEHLESQREVKLREIEARRAVSVGYSLLLGGTLYVPRQQRPLGSDSPMLPPRKPTTARLATAKTSRNQAPQTPAAAVPGGNRAPRRERAAQPTRQNGVRDASPRLRPENSPARPGASAAPPPVQSPQTPSESQSLAARVISWLRGRR